MASNAIIYITPGEPIDNALKRLSKLMQKSGAFRSAAKHESFTPRNEERRTRRNAATRRQAKRNV